MLTNTPIWIKYFTSIPTVQHSCLQFSIIALVDPSSIEIDLVATLKLPPNFMAHLRKVSCEESHCTDPAHSMLYSTLHALLYSLDPFHHTRNIKPSRPISTWTSQSKSCLRSSQFFRTTKKRWHAYASCIGVGWVKWGGSWESMARSPWWPWPSVFTSPIAAK